MGDCKSTAHVISRAKGTVNGGKPMRAAVAVPHGATDAACQEHIHLAHPEHLAGHHGFGSAIQVDAVLRQLWATCIQCT